MCNMASIRLVHILWFLIAGMLFITQCYGNPPGGGSRGQRRRLQRLRNMNRGAGLRPEMIEAYVSAYDVDRTTPSPWVSLAPSLPSPEEVECHITVAMTQRHGGRCVRLGGSNMPHACQSGEHLEIQEHCERIASTRNQQQGHGPHGQHHDRK